MEEVVDQYSLAQLGRAITRARRPDSVRVWRTFVRTRGGGQRFVREAREDKTQRLVRIRPQHAAP
jgi:hypothetical protein